MLVGILCGIVAPANLLYIDAGYKTLQPISLLAWAMVSFAFAEFVHASGIIAVMCYGMLIKSYAIRNLAAPEREAFENIVSAAAHVSEATIFVILGIQCVLSVYGKAISTLFLPMSPAFSGPVAPYTRP